MNKETPPSGSQLEPSKEPFRQDMKEQPLSVEERSVEASPESDLAKRSVAEGTSEDPGNLSGFVEVGQIQQTERGEDQVEEPGRGMARAEANRSKADTEVSPEEFEQVKQEVDQLADLLLKNLRIPPGEVERPAIEFTEKPDRTSGYDTGSNTLCFHSRDFHSINAYGEELAHWIRAQLVEEDPDKILENTDLDEFLGRLGEYYAREVVKGTELETTFEEELSRDIRSQEAELEQIEDICRKGDLVIENTKREIENYKQGAREITAKIIKLRSGLEYFITELSKSPKEENISREALVAFYQQISQEFSSFINEINRISSESKILSGSISIPLEIMGGHFKIFKRLAEREDIAMNEYILSSFKNKLNDLIKDCDHMQFSLSGNPLELDRTLRFRILELFNRLDHIEGYVAAEYYVENVSNWLDTMPALFRSPYDTLEKYLNTTEVDDWMEKNGVRAITDKLIELNELLEESESDEEKVGIWAKGKARLQGLIGRILQMSILKK